MKNLIVLLVLALAVMSLSLVVGSDAEQTVRVEAYTPPAASLQAPQPLRPGVETKQVIEAASPKKGGKVNLVKGTRKQ